MSSPRSTDQDISYSRGRGGSAHQDYYVSGALQGPQRRSLHVPASYSRPRSAPPRRRDRSSSRGRSPMSSTRNVVKDTFTSSLPGLGVGVVGAVVGGLAARELSDAAARRRSRSPHQHQTSRLLTSLAGAAALGLGLNALERKLEDERQREREEEEALEHKWEPPKGQALLGAGEGRASRRRPGSAADYYDVHNGYDYVYDRKIKPRRSDDTLRTGRSTRGSNR